MAIWIWHAEQTGSHCMSNLESRRLGRHHNAHAVRIKDGSKTQMQMQMPKKGAHYFFLDG